MGHLKEHVTPETLEALSDPTDKIYKILVVDDDRICLTTLEKVLIKKGFQVDTVIDGIMALEYLEKNKPDLMLLDYMMPNMDGFELCRRIKEDSRFDDIPVLFMSGESDIQRITDCFKIGAGDYIRKPFNQAELTARLNTHLNLSRNKKTLRDEIKNIKTYLQDMQLQIQSGQQGLLADPAQFKDLNCAMRFEPILEAGGDYYDIIQLSDTKYGILVADVSGHNLGISYLTGALKALTVSFTNEMLSVEETIFMLNNALCKFLPLGEYVTAVYMKYDIETKQVEIINAGHPNALIQKADGSNEYLELTGDVLGIHDTVQCQSQVFNVEPGDQIYLFSDGLTESYPDEKGKTGSRAIGESYVALKMKNNQELSLQKRIDHIVDDLIHNMKTIDDDIVLLGIQF